MAENFEKPPLGEKPEPGPGPEPEPEEEVLGGEPKEGAEKVQIVEKEPETPEEVEAEFYEKLSKLEELRLEISKEYNYANFGELRAVVIKMKNETTPDALKVQEKNQVLIDLVEKLDEKERQIRNDRDEKNRKLAEQRREKLRKRVEEI